MTKKKRKTISRKKKAPAKPKLKQFPALERRIDEEFAKALHSAKSYVEDPSRLDGLFEEAVAQLPNMSREPFADTWPYFHAMLRLIRVYAEGDYRDISDRTFVIIIAAIIYVVDPLDVIPDSVPGIGLLDDATVVFLAIKRGRDALDRFMAWELGRS